MYVQNSYNSILLLIDRIETIRLMNGECATVRVMSIVCCCIRQDYTCLHIFTAGSEPELRVTPSYSNINGIAGVSPLVRQYEARNNTWEQRGQSA